MSQVVLKRMLKIVLVLLLFSALAFLGFAHYIGAWNVLFPSSRHDSTPPSIPAALESPAIMVFSKTNRFRHKEGIAAGQEALSSIARAKGWSVFATENGAIFNDADLQRFAVVVFLNATGDMLSRSQEQAFESWLQAGGGWVGIHAAGDGSHSEWDWYMENLIGAKFTAHILGPQFQTATVITEEPEHPVNRDMPAVWDHTEEWYSWENSPRARGFLVLATVDENSYTPEQNFVNSSVDLRMGDHPIVWANCVGKGRTVYSAMGHAAEAFESADHRRLLRNMLDWALSRDSSACQGAITPE